MAKHTKQPSTTLTTVKQLSTLREHTSISHFNPNRTILMIPRDISFRDKKGQEPLQLIIAGRCELAGLALQGMVITGV